MANILIIDDDEKFCTMLKITLEKAGYEVQTAGNAEVGLESIRESTPDLVVMDLLMPEKEGIETIIELHRDFPDVKIVAVSGGGFMGPESYLALAEQMGASSSFSKPLEMAKFLDAVRELVGLDS
ncbi:response regulator [Candidatus Hydrogenedentota bacterium]